MSVRDHSPHSASSVSGSPRHRAGVAHAIHSLGLGGAQQVIKYLVSHGDKYISSHGLCGIIRGVSRRGEAAGASVTILRRHVPKFDPFWVRQLATRLRRDKVQLLHTHLSVTAARDDRSSDGRQHPRHRHTAQLPHGFQRPPACWLQVDAAARGESGGLLGVGRNLVPHLGPRENGQCDPERP